MREEKKELYFGKEKKQAPQWKASPEIYDMCLTLLKGALPVTIMASEADLEKAYGRGVSLYKAGRYDEAMAYFQTLSTINPKDSRYLMGTSASLHMKKDYYAAIQCYNLTSILDPDDPLPLYHMADCYIRLQQPVGAYMVLEMAIPRCDKDPLRFKGLKDRMTVMLNSLIKEFEAKKNQGVTNFRNDVPKEKTLGELEKKLNVKFNL